LIILDSFAWFEYFAGSNQGARVREALESGERAGTPASCVTELIRKRAREKKPYQKQIDFIERKSEIIPLDLRVAKRAGCISKLHFADAIVYASALENGARVITGDKHFAGLPDVELLKR
jgi:predicted nucleic acid-binding protein